ncbi:MAG: hypothetical protein ABIQ40_06505 [Bacteroidia bacterium]
MKLRSRTFLVLLILTVFLTACRKDHVPPHTIVQGKVLEYGSNQPLANKQVIIGRRDAGFGPGNYATVAVLNSDAGGNYYYEFDGVDNSIYVVACTSVSPYSASEYYTITVGQLNPINIILSPPGWIKLHVENVQQQYDQIILGGNIVPNVYFSGVQVDSTMILQFNGNANINIYWRMSNSTIINDTTVNIYIPSFDTISYNISY